MKEVCRKHKVVDKSLAPLRLILSLGTIFAALPQNFAEAEAASGKGVDLIVTVRIHNYARVPRSVLAKAQEEGSGIFQHVGLQVRWIECPLSSRDLDRFPACREPLSLTGLDLSIVPHAMTARLTIPETTLGFTPMSRDGERGSLADIFYDHLVAQAEVTQEFLPQIMGHAFAHEIGHLLLRTTRHSPTGIMRAQWTPRDLQRAVHGELLFTPEESELIRAEVLARTRQQTTSTHSKLEAVK